MNSFSAKDLCTRSCMQLKMFMEHPEKKPNMANNIHVAFGEQFQHKVANKIPNVIGEEMKGTWTGQGITINFSNDIITNDTVYEVKYIDAERPAELWYLEASLLQCAIYKALILETGGYLKTASFYKNLGHEEVVTRMPPQFNYILIFGNDKYIVHVTNPRQILHFIIDKAIASLDWTTAKEFDNKYKHKEFETLKKYFYYETIR